MQRTRRRPSHVGLGLGVAALALWPSCGGKSIRNEGGAGEEPEPTSGGTGVGGGPSGGVGASPNGGANPNGGVGATVPNGGVGATVPNGGVGATTSSGGVSPQGGVGNSPFGGASGNGFGGVGVSGFGGGFGGVGFGGTIVAGAGGRIGGRMGGAGFGGRTGGAGGAGGRFGGRMGFGGASGVGGFGGGVSGAGGLGPNPLDGFAFFTPCGRGMIPACRLSMSCDSPEPSLPGIHPTDVTVVMPGFSGVLYETVIRVQGVVESKTYSGGVDQDGYSSIFPADGLYTGGVPTPTLASTYLVRVSSPARDYFLNSISPPTMSSVAPPAPVDFRASILFEGGTTIRLVSADADCSVLPNCGVASPPSSCSPVSVPNLDPRLGIIQPYAGQFLAIVAERTVVVALVGGAPAPPPASY